MIHQVFVFAAGLSIGSFLNVCIYRLPRSLSIVRPRSFCPACENPIKPRHNVPVISYLLLMGRCGYCGARISPRYPLVEFLNGLLYLYIFHRFGIAPHTVFYMAFASALVVITFIDLDYQIIPDAITLPGMLLGLGAAMFILPDPHDLSRLLGLKGSLVGLLTGGTIFYVIAVVSPGGMGGGDIKMMGLVGSVLGWKSALLTIFVGSFFGSVYGLGLMAFKGAGRKARVPFGPFLALGTLFSLFFARDAIALYWRLI
jgi:leader peptidase (prepilin peptidase)/N-methyltransferase